jgi:hypothetical protein
MGSTESKANPLLVNIQILGVQKAGTSALAQFLSEHPDICLVANKEAHVFDQPNYAEQPCVTEFAAKRYAKKLVHYAGEQYICDATPITLFNPTYLRRCVEYNPNAKFIVVLRNPIDRAISHYSMSKARGREKRNILMSFLLESIRLKKESQDSDWPSGSPWRDQSYLKRGEYTSQLHRLNLLVPNSQVLVIRQEDLLNQHNKTLQDVFTFLNLEPVNVKQRKIFSQAEKPKGIIYFLAGLYARLYFAAKGKD